MRGALFLPVSALLLVAAMPQMALAQKSGGGASTATGRSVPRGDLDRTRYQDRLCARDGTCDSDSDLDRDRDRTRDQDRDRLRTSEFVDGQLATFSLLTAEERERFRNEMRNAKTTEERTRVRAEHQKIIQDRAREMGIEPPSSAGVADVQARARYMLMTMLTEQERLQFMNRIHLAKSPEERERIRTEMHEQARERARAMGVDVPEWYGRGPGGR